MNRTIIGLGVVALAAIPANAQLTFEFVKGPGLLSYESTHPTEAAAMYDAAVSAGSKWSSVFHNPVTLKYTLDYAPGLPSGVLGLADSAYLSVPYTAVKTGLITGASSPSDMMAIGSLPAGPLVAMMRNDVYDLTFPEVEIIVDPGPSPNNMLMDVSHSNAKALGLIPATSGAAGSDATIKVGSASFDFDPTDGISPGTFDFEGVMLHEIGHAMGFVSGVDTMATLFPSPLGPPAMDPDFVTMLTVLDLYRYSPLSFSMGIRDLSLPMPGATGPAAERFFSIGMGPIDYFSTGYYEFADFGDGQQAGHWKDDGTFGLMDPELDPGVALTASWDSLIATGMTSDLLALDVIGWNTVPSPGAGTILGLGLMLAARRRRGLGSVGSPMDRGARRRMSR